MIVPIGQTEDFEEPDFKIQTASGLVGLEVTELLPLPNHGSFNSPLAEKSYCKEVVQLAEREYYRAPDAIPVKVTVHFWHVDRRKHSIRDLAHSLADFVGTHYDSANGIANYNRRHLPEGFGAASIALGPEAWFCGGSMTITLDGIRAQLAARIRDKNAKLPMYRSNVPNAPIWLLIYSGDEIMRGVPMPHGIEEWAFPFDFDRVLFFQTGSNEIREIRRI